MPRGDEKHKLIYEELVNILGPDYVSDDPVVMEALSRDSKILYMPQRAEFVVLPGSTEDVQQIIKLANRYKFPVGVVCTGQLVSTSLMGNPYWCMIDSKRMDRLEIDEKNKYAIVEPFTTQGQLVAEAMKRGLYAPVPGGGATTAVMSNNLVGSIQWTSNRVGIGRSILGVELVLPTGDILRTGSLAVPGGSYCWGEGPGPDARGLLRALFGNWGAFGVVTRMAVKLFSWPGPHVWPTEGVQPEKKCVLPPERFKYFYISYPTFEKSVEAIREIGIAELGGSLMKFAPWDFVCWGTKSREEFWQLWDSEFWAKKCGHIVAVGLWGFASEKQVAYEEKVLKQIIQDTGGELVPDEVQQWLDSNVSPNFIRDTWRCRFLRAGGHSPFGTITMDSLGDVLERQEEGWKLLDRYTPPLGEMRRQSKFWPSDFARYALLEVDGMLTGKSAELDRVLNFMKQELLKDALEYSVLHGMVASLLLHISGPAFSNVHQFVATIKKSLDPNNISTPNLLINMDEIEKMGVGITSGRRDQGK